jgi:hypothetical protein
MLLAAFGARRPTADLDALARGFANDQATVVAHVIAVAQHDIPDDGVEFRAATTTSRIIPSEDLYSGVRIAMDCAMASAIVKLRLDINFGDPVTPAPQTIALPALRPGDPPISILGYPSETVRAEKISTAIALGQANTRVRDYADICTLTGRHNINRADARAALLATAAYRDVQVIALSAAIADIAELRSQTFNAYRDALGPGGIDLPPTIETVVDAVTAFADGLARPEPPNSNWDSNRQQWAAPGD